MSQFLHYLPEIIIGSLIFFVAHSMGTLYGLGKRQSLARGDVLSVARFLVEEGSGLIETPEMALMAADMFIRTGRFPNLDTPPHE